MTWLDYAAIRRRVSIRDVVRLLNWQPLQQRGAQWRGNCPFCQANSSRRQRHRIFSVHLTQHIFRCFHCQCAGNVLDLWVHHTKLPIAQAALNLCHQLQIPIAEVTLRNVKTRLSPPAISQPPTPPSRDNGRAAGRD